MGQHRMPLDQEFHGETITSRIRSVDSYTFEERCRGDLLSAQSLRQRSRVLRIRRLFRQKPTSLALLSISLNDPGADVDCHGMLTYRPDVEAELRRHR
jgi:hypothetical protein